MREVTPLFYYLPDSPDNLKDEMDRRVEECGLTIKFSELREPSWTDPAVPTLLEWHQEGSSIDKCVLWASAQPTEFRLKSNHAAVPVRAGLAVLIDNQRIEHRMPAGDLRNLHRFFYKAIVGG